MKPLCLKMNAFGTFAKETVIDFRTIGTKDVFLITGNTGSGKTTIFDAISFALYGEGSGGNKRREMKNIHSDYVSEKEKLSVKLLFEHQGKEYTIERSIKIRTKNGKRESSVDASLFCNTTEKLIADRSTDVNAAIVNMLRLKREQFAQTIMIAQGEFQKIISANSQERRNIFQSLFHTEIYEQFEEKLRIRSNELQKKYEQEETSILDSMKRGIFDGEHQFPLSLEIGNVPQYLDALQQQNQVYEAKKITISENQAKYHQENDELIRNIAEVKTTNQQLDDLAKRRSQLDALEQQEPAMQDYETILKRARAALGVMSSERVLITAQHDRDRKTADYEKLCQRSKQIVEELLQSQTRFERASKDAQQMESLQKEIHDLEQAKPIFRQIKDKEKELASATTELTRVNGILEIAEVQYRRMQELYFLGQAGLLAERLQENQPCPVCGSIHHPQKAVRPKGTPSEVDLQKAEQHKLKQQKLYEEQSQICTSLTSELNTLRRNPYIQGLTEDTLGNQLLANKNLLFELRTTLEKADKAFRKTKSESDKISGQIKELESAIEQLKEEISREEDAFRYALEENHFEDVADYQQAKRDAKEIDALDRALQKYHSDVKAVKSNIAYLEEQTAGKSYHPTDKLENRLIMVKNALTEFESKLRTYHNALLNNEKIHKELEEHLSWFDLLQKKYMTVAEMYKTVSGQMGSGQAKLKLETYIQQHYFRRVVLHANERLNMLTEEQFALRCRETAVNGRSQSGLDLEVWDRNTGIWRDVNTLSGGESFLASLSLALGLSDVVQNNTGGVELDTLFIDEGFGTLDSDTLRQAVNLLGKLADGNRMIGVISHVEELRMRIEHQIRVTKTPEGSIVEIV
ncbi:MAG: SMC family ATPase [Oscillospiraceae bacterium]